MKDVICSKAHECHADCLHRIPHNPNDMKCTIWSECYEVDDGKKVRCIKVQVQEAAHD